MSAETWTMRLGMLDRVLSEARSQSHEIERRLQELEQAQRGWLRADAHDGLEPGVKEEESDG